MNRARAVNSTSEQCMQVWQALRVESVKQDLSVAELIEAMWLLWQTEDDADKAACADHIHSKRDCQRVAVE